MQVVRAIDPKCAATPGLVNGSVMLLYDTSPGRNIELAGGPASRPYSPAMQKIIAGVYGEATLSVDRSNLATLPIVSTLYDVMSLGQDARKATGNGTLRADMERGTFSITNLRYFNRGVEARVLLTSEKMWNFPDNPVHVTAVGAAQPLASIKLPVIPDIQGALTVLQGGLTTIEGDAPNWRRLEKSLHLIPFGAAGKDMREFIFGDVSGDKTATPAP